ncbi:B-cell antigen receptor complex-associated protein beta chain [Xenentodon cancila]
MRWILAGCCGLALVSLSVALQVNQKPRFYSVNADIGQKVIIYCLAYHAPNSSISWFKVDKYNMEKGNQELQKSDKIHFTDNYRVKNSALYILDVRTEDSGVYFCKIKDEWGPGTEVQVFKHANLLLAEYRSKMKDGLIVLQGLMIALCVAAVLLRKQKVMEKRDSIYEDPETDHIYEGLAIETCGGGLYEELPGYSHADGTEAPWE